MFYYFDKPNYNYVVCRHKVKDKFLLTFIHQGIRAFRASEQDHAVLGGCLQESLHGDGDRGKGE